MSKTTRPRPLSEPEDDRSPRQAVRRHTTYQDEDQMKGAHGEQNNAYSGTRMGHEQHLPGERDRENTIAQARNSLSGPEHCIGT